MDAGGKGVRVSHLVNVRVPWIRPPPSITFEIRHQCSSALGDHSLRIKAIIYIPDEHKKDIRRPDVRDNAPAIDPRLHCGSIDPSAAGLLFDAL